MYVFTKLHLHLDFYLNKLNALICNRSTCRIRAQFHSFVTLVIGGVVGAVFPALLTFVAIGARYCFRNEINKLKKEEGFVKKRVIAALMPLFIPMTVTSIATGVGLAVIANAVLPGIFATWWAIAAGAGIGVIALPTGVVTGITVASIFAGSIHECIMPDDCAYGPA